jgi:hypothetical protein
VLKVSKEKVRNLIERWLTAEEEQRLVAASPSQAGCKRDHCLRGQYATSAEWCRVWALVGEIWLKPTKEGQLVATLTGRYAGLVKLLSGGKLNLAIPDSTGWSSNISPAWCLERPDDELISLCRSVKLIPTPPAEPVIDEDERSKIIFVQSSSGVLVQAFRDVPIGQNGFVILAPVRFYLVRRPHQFRHFFGRPIGLKISQFFAVLVRANTWIRWTVSATC